MSSVSFLSLCAVCVLPPLLFPLPVSSFLPPAFSSLFSVALILFYSLLAAFPPSHSLSRLLLSLSSSRHHSAKFFSASPPVLHVSSFVLGSSSRIFLSPPLFLIFCIAIPLTLPAYQRKRFRVSGKLLLSVYLLLPSFFALPSPPLASLCFLPLVRILYWYYGLAACRRCFFLLCFPLSPSKVPTDPVTFIQYPPFAFSLPLCLSRLRDGHAYG